MPSTTLSIALVGNPNCGKTALFNRLTGGAFMGFAAVMAAVRN